MHQAGKAARVAVHSKVVEVADQLPPQRCMLLLHRAVSMLSTPHGYGLDRTSQSYMPGLTLHRPYPPAASPPIEGEPQKVERARTFPVVVRRRPAKLHQSSLLRVQGQ